MHSVTHEEIRNQILEFIYEMSKEETTTWGIDRDTLLRFLKIPEKDMDADVLYLAQRNMITTLHSEGVLWYLARITPFGKDVVENRQLYENRFPFLKAGKSSHK